MFDKSRLERVLTQYKKDFLTGHWADEMYKWEAVKCFQNNWDIKGDDFADMLSRSLAQTYNLLASINNYPAKMITEFAKAAPEEVRAMYMDLFDESKEVYERIDAFKRQSSLLLEKYGDGAGQHYQYENAITTYLWLRFPDKYYIYKFGDVKNAANELASDYRFKKGAYADNIRDFYRFYDEICEVLKQDGELVNLFRSQLTDTCYPDPELKTLTKDIVFYIHYDYVKPTEQKEAAAPAVKGNEKPLPIEPETEVYTKADFLSEVYLSGEQYERLKGVLLNKKNIILQGAPGVGKTFCAKRLTYSLMGEKDDSRIEFVQFHQNYSYEDFMMGYKPSGKGFELKYGVLYRFCQKAANQPNQPFSFIIDEINRGNMSKIFGELLMLIEKDYRGTKTTLAYNGMSFAVPENLYIIGMMNTADRSLAMIDYALRRRFSFFDIEPGFASKGFRDYQASLENEIFDELISKIVELNEEIRRDKSLGKGFCIGHSYFCGRTKETCTDEWLQSVVDYDILPMLAEYWFDDDSKVLRWENILHGVFQ